MEKAETTANAANNLVTAQRPKVHILSFRKLLQIQVERTCSDSLILRQKRHDMVLVEERIVLCEARHTFDVGAVGVDLVLLEVQGRQKSEH